MRRRPRKPHHAPPFSPAYALADSGAKTLLVPGYRQARNYSCGFATALMVVRYFRPHAPARELFDALGTTRDGTRQNAMVRAIRACGLGANVRYDVDFARLQQEIDRNKLVVGYLHDSDHWVVLYGYGCDPPRVYIADPEPGEPCVHSWQRYRDKLAGFGIVCSCARMSRRRAPPAVPHRLALPPAPVAAADEAPAARVLVPAPPVAPNEPPAAAEPVAPNEPPAARALPRASAVAADETPDRAAEEPANEAPAPAAEEPANDEHPQLSFAFARD